MKGSPLLRRRVTQTNINSSTPMIPQGWVATGLRAPDLRVNVTLPVYSAGQHIYLFWPRSAVRRLIPHKCMRIEMNTPTRASALGSGLPQSSPSTCDCQRETAVLCTAQFKFILYVLERRLHFTVHLSLRLEQRLCALQRFCQTQSIKALFLESSSITAETRLW